MADDDMTGADATLSAAIRGKASYHAAPPALSARVRAAIAEADANDAGSPPPSHGPTMSPVWRPMALAASFAFVSLLSWNVWTGVMAPERSAGQAPEIVAAHVRSLMANHLTDVSSSDQHTVKPWFNGKLDISPPVSDLTAPGFALVGGRLDYLDQRPVAALVYRHRQHIINLFVWPTGTEINATATAAMTRQGYNLLHWHDNGLVYWAVSDLAAVDLNEFERLVRMQSKGP
jgi:anti-sigma factor RsiW